MRSLAAIVLALAGTLSASCRSDETARTNFESLGFAAAGLETGELSEVSRRLNRVLSDSEGRGPELAAQRFFAAFLLARVHAAASLDRAFLSETTYGAPVGSGLGGSGLGRRDAHDGRRLRPSTRGHVLATVYHASLARGLLEGLDERALERARSELLPGELGTWSLEELAVHLELLEITSFARLGFQGELDRVLSRSPALLSVSSCLETLDAYRIQRRMAPWVCAMVFAHLKERNEPEAYRFAVTAVEGVDRFGYRLPERTIAELDAWIVDGASVRFVCPKSGTPYLPGERRSPVSGVPHLEYVAVPR